MKLNLNFDKAKRKNLNKMMIKCKRFTRKNLSKKDDKVQIICLKIQVCKSLFLKKFDLHFIRHFCENSLTLFLLAMMIW